MIDGREQNEAWRQRDHARDEKGHRDEREDEFTPLEPDSSASIGA